MTDYFADHPVFVDALPSQVTGVDFLGLAAVNERFVATALPGISNVTRYMRVYSVMSWLAWRFSQHVREQSQKGKLTEAQIARSFKRYREKVELLFTVGNPGYKQVAGNTRSSYMPDGRGAFPLEFSEFGSFRISWLDAAVYGPSLATTNGLGFIERAPGRSYRPTDLGEDAAAALDESLRKSNFYHRLYDIEDNMATRAMIDDLGSRWRIRESTAKERSVFRRAFVPPAIGQEGTSLVANRVAMTRLVVRSLEAMKGSGTVEDVRRTIARGAAESGKEVELSGCEMTQGLWRVLQLRQLQRLAHEALLRWVEIALVHSPSELKGRTPGMLADLAADQVESGLGMSRRSKLSTLLSRVCIECSEVTYFLAGLKERYVDPFVMIDQLQKLTDIGRDFRLLPSSAIAALALCAGETERMGMQDTTRNLIAVGGRGRISLKTLLEHFRAYGDHSIEKFVHFVIGSCVIGQHFAVTNAKLEPQKNKFRFISGNDEGLRPLIKPDQITRLNITGDRLENAMELMADCGMIWWDPGSETFALT